VRDGNQWRTFWTSVDAPIQWRQIATPLTRALRWRQALSGVEWSDVALAGSGEAWRTRLVVARVRPDRVQLRLDTAFVHGSPDWSLRRVPDQAVLAVNAGQFETSMPWGWVVLNGHQWLSPQRGPLSAVLAQDTDGTLFWLRGDDIVRAAGSASARSLRWAFQSYPVLLQSDTVPSPLRGAGQGVDVAHRDARTAICIDHRGNLLIALTRFDALGAGLGFLPFGLTTPEMAAVMGALGCQNAMLLDGGISAQLYLRDRRGVHEWRGLRKVPLALVAEPRL
jgi:uncharacterized protein YigE (DUF2233 family)